MTPLGVWLTITTTVTIGILFGVVLSWIDQPSWVTPLRLVLILVLAAAADSVVVYVQQTVPVVAGPSTQDAAAASDAGLVPASRLARARRRGPCCRSPGRRRATRGS